MNMSGVKVRIKSLPFEAVDWALVREVRRLQGRVRDLEKRIERLESGLGQPQ